MTQNLTPPAPDKPLHIAPQPSDYMEQFRAETGLQSISDTDAAEYLETLFNIMKSFVDAGWEVQRIPRYLTELSPENGKPAAPMVNLPHKSIHSQFGQSAQESDDKSEDNEES